MAERSLRVPCWVSGEPAQAPLKTVPVLILIMSRALYSLQFRGQGVLGVLVLEVLLVRLWVGHHGHADGALGLQPDCGSLLLVVCVVALLLLQLGGLLLRLHLRLGLLVSPSHAE